MVYNIKVTANIACKVVFLLNITIYLTEIKTLKMNINSQLKKLSFICVIKNYISYLLVSSIRSAVERGSKKSSVYIFLFPNNVNVKLLKLGKRNNTEIKKLKPT
jgi:hypothetical protein